MIWLAHPLRLLAVAVWVLVIIVMARRQTAALAWIRANVAPRFHRALTAYTPLGVALHLLFLLVSGSLLATAAAGPSTIGTVEGDVQTRSIILALDASLSMGATDAGPADAPPGEPPDDPADDPAGASAQLSRFDRASRFARGVVEAMPDAAVGVVSFSGVTVVHMPPTRDHAAVTALLETLTYHVDFNRSGTRVSSVLDAVLQMVRRTPGSYQLVVLSDGELPQPDELDEALNLLADLSVPVHAVGVGSTDGQARVVYDLEDVIEGAEDRQVVARYHTARVDATLARLASATGGTVVTLETGGAVDDLVPWLRQAPPSVESVVGTGRRDLSGYLVALFGVCFLLETLWLPRRRAGGPAVRTRRSVTAAVSVAAAAAVSAGCQSRTWLAHTHNEEGIVRYGQAVHDEAAASFERSIGYRVRQHVPLVNLANTAMAQGDISTAHELYENAIVLRPDLPEAHFNDGHVLYQWGELEIDPTGCNLERTRQLWDEALDRFARAEALAGWNLGLAAGAAENAATVRDRLPELDALAEQCAPPPPPPAGGEAEAGGGESEPREAGGGESEPGERGGGQGARGEGGGGAGEGRGSGGDPSGPPPLSDEERREIEEALGRIGQETSGGSDFRHAGPQQLSPEKARRAKGVRVWW